MFKLFKNKPNKNYVSINHFPKQGFYFRKKVDVTFDMSDQSDFSTGMLGVVMRNDAEAPNVTIIRLINGRHILGSECDFSLHG